MLSLINQEELNFCWLHTLIGNWTEIDYEMASLSPKKTVHITEATTEKGAKVNGMLGNVLLH